MSDFYTEKLQRFLHQGLLRPDMHILVICGGRPDREAFLKAGFKHVTISNLDSRMTGDEFSPYAWSFQDAEHLTFADGAFDFCVVHDGLHHCHSPHRALLEMYRVSRLGLLAFDPRDTLLTRIGVRLGFGQEYEVAAVAGNDCTFGGIRNTDIPNYVYRWTESEVRKTINCNAPYGRHRFFFFYRLRLPLERFQMLKNKLWLAAIGLAWPALKLFSLLFPKQCNNFGFAVFKPAIPADLLPWIKEEKGLFKLNREWVTAHYHPLRGR